MTPHSWARDKEIPYEVKPCTDAKGYKHITAYIHKLLKRISIHKTVIELFGPEKPHDARYVIFKDGDRNNTDISNLVWSKNTKSQITDEVKDAIRNEPDTMSNSAIARKYGIGYGSASRIRQSRVNAESSPCNNDTGE